MLVYGVALLGIAQRHRGRPAVPRALEPPAGAKLLLRLHASGDQIYVSDGHKWVLSRPDAKLYDEKGNVAGRHFAGPTWEYTDHSQVVGKAIASTTPNPDSIPWLLVRAKDHKGDGKFRNVTFIQRENTRGGKAPRAVGEKGKEAREHYSAEYLFFTGGVGGTQS